MAQYKLEDIEVKGATILAFVDGLGTFKRKALQILEENGIKDIQPEKWYSAQNYLNAFKTIHNTLGNLVIKKIGEKIPENASWPPEIKNIEQALASIDIAYHMNHRKNGKAMFDPATGKLTEGIGHYKFQKITENSAKVTCDGIYPCDFDLGTITAVAKKFAPAGVTVKVKHADGSCRKKGDPSCTYIIRW